MSIKKFVLLISVLSVLTLITLGVRNLIDVRTLEDNVFLYLQNKGYVSEDINSISTDNFGTLFKPTHMVFVEFSDEEGVMYSYAEDNLGKVKQTIAVNTNNKKYLDHTGVNVNKKILKHYEYN